MTIHYPELHTGIDVAEETTPPLLTQTIQDHRPIPADRLNLYLLRLEKLLAEQLGSAVRSLFKPIVKHWQRLYPPTRDNLFYLLEQLGGLFDQPLQYSAFMYRAELIQQQTL